MQNTRIGIIISNIIQFIKNKIYQIRTEDSSKEESFYLEQRKFVGNIIISVLTEQINVKKALTLFPKGCEDESIRTAWHALCHYEADEDIRNKDKEYNNEQISFLEMIAFEFKDGTPLPQNIIDAYKPYYKDNPISYEKGIKGIIKKLFRFLFT